MNKIIESLKYALGIKKVDRFLGVLDEQQSNNVYDFPEIVASAGNPNWVTKKIEDVRTFLFQNQDYSSACVAFSVAKIAQVLFYLDTKRLVKFSPGWIYKQRSPKIPGMSIDNAISIAGGGLPSEEFYPSENLDEEQINNLPTLPYVGGIAKEFSISTNWVNLPPDFDTVASTIQATQKGIMLWFNFGVGEWFGQPVPLIKGGKLVYRHSVVAVDFLIYQGQQYLVIEDSADGQNYIFKHRKLISREFFEERAYLSRYPINFKFDVVNTKPRYDGTTSSLQDCLKYDGSMPTNIPSTGYFGNLTVESVKRFQFKYGIQQTGSVGPITGAKLVELFP